jgi:hypothetical protein
MDARRQTLDSEAAMLTIFAEFPEKINGKRALRHLSQGSTILEVHHER